MMAALVRSGKFRHRHKLTERKSCEERDRQAQKEDGCLKVEAETRVMLPKLRNIWSYQKLEESGKDLLLEASEDYGPANNLILKF